MKRHIDVDALNKKHGNVNYQSGLTFMAYKNRHTPTETEEIIWKEILRYEKTGFKFSRQKPINRFILDFYCSKLGLAIEIDGGSHFNKKEVDILRDRFLVKIGIQTIRFTTNEVMNNLEEVRIKIIKTCKDLACQGEVVRQLAERSGLK